MQDELLARVNFGEIVQKTFWWIKYWRISHTWMHIRMYLCKNITGGVRFYPKIANRQNLLIANILSYMVY